MRLRGKAADGALAAGHKIRMKGSARPSRIQLHGDPGEHALSFCAIDQLSNASPFGRLFVARAAEGTGMLEANRTMQHAVTLLRVTRLGISLSFR